MTCANIMLTIAAGLSFLFAVWPGFGGETVTKWVVGLCSLAIIAVTWTGVDCEWCKVKKKKK